MLTCYSPYGEATEFPRYFADLSMWVARVEAKAPPEGVDGKPIKAQASRAAKSQPPAAQCIPHHHLRSMDLEASVPSDYLAARKKERSRRGKAGRHKGLDD